MYQSQMHPNVEQSPTSHLLSMPRKAELVQHLHNPLHPRLKPKELPRMQRPLVPTRREFHDESQVSSSAVNPTMVSQKMSSMVAAMTILSVIETLLVGKREVPMMSRVRLKNRSAAS